MSRLVGINAKIGRAKKHVQDFEAAIHALLDDPSFYEIEAKDKPGTGYVGLYFKNIKPVPEAISLIAGDAIHNLRSSLDHLIWQLVEANNCTPLSRNEYPIFDTFQKTSKKDTAEQLARKIEGVSPHAQQIIKATQPYLTGDLTLWHLQQLDIMDKHKLILTVNHVASAWGLKDEKIWLGDIVFGYDPKPGDHLFNMPPDTYAAHKDNIELGFDITFGEPTIIAGQPVLETLKGMVEFVEDVLLPQFKPML
jgi:hypothetical protein